MKRILLLLLLLLPVAFLSPLYAQPHYEFRMLDASGGLPENNVRDMLMRDIFLKEDGSVIAAGDNGPFRYHPSTDVVDRIDTVDAHTLTNQLLQDAAGRVWLAESG